MEVNERETEWRIKGSYLKKLRADHEMSRAELARQMNVSEARLARLENGNGVKDAKLLSNYYELIFKHHDLENELEALYILHGRMMKKYVYTTNSVREESLINNLEQIRSMESKANERLIKGSNQLMSEKTRFNPRNII
ncbi:helix-turn-helix domain-containing protein [Sporosarcina sp. ACRSL]|uniref:helix-turn-helix domain-containing protein n=1 Tax=Sporosarcina sp. ACRSL TaxID=2918215 RepID=UPI001EF58A84|nr:helix-turn-helix transcriptional regulator [Sporosarcina sp. ACRSL]MCG7346080.1 helix-turn-helix domain-containing protein [Sporosarcina sp. ACRSL]